CAPIRSDEAASPAKKTSSRLPLEPAFQRGVTPGSEVRAFLGIAYVGAGRREDGDRNESVQSGCDLRQGCPQLCHNALLLQNAVGLGVNLLLIGRAQFSLMLHLGGASLGIPGVARIRHWVFPL